MKIVAFKGGLSNSSFFDNTVKQEETIINKIFGNTDNITTMTEFLNNFKIGSTKLCPIKGILVRGRVGCGKMTLIYHCLNLCNYSNLMYDTDYKNEDIYDNLLLSLEVRGITKMFQENKKKAIIIRDVDNALKPTQKTNFFKYISSSKNSIPVFMTSNDLSVGSRREVPKCILQLNFDISVEDITEHFTKLYNNISHDDIEKIINSTGCDIRQINIFFSENQKIGKTPIINYKKDIEIDTFKSIKLCASSCDMDDKLIQSSIYTNCTMFHNYPLLVNEKCPNSMNILSEIADICCMSDEIMKHVFTNQDWSLDEYYCSIGTIYPINKLKQYESPNKFSKRLDKLTYPSSMLTHCIKQECDFKTLEYESILLKIIIPKYFKDNKFKSDSSIDEFNKEMKAFKYPIQAFKLGIMMSNDKKNNVLLREFKKKLIVHSDL